MIFELQRLFINNLNVHINLKSIIYSPKNVIGSLEAFNQKDVLSLGINFSHYEFFDGNITKNSKERFPNTLYKNQQFSFNTILVVSQPIRNMLEEN